MIFFSPFFTWNFLWNIFSFLNKNKISVPLLDQTCFCHFLFLCGNVQRNEVGGEGVTGRREQIPFQSALQPFPMSACHGAAGTNPAGITRTWIKQGQTYITCNIPFGKKLFLSTQTFRSAAACLPLQTAVLCAAAEKELGLVCLKRYKCLIKVLQRGEMPGKT